MSQTMIVTRQFRAKKTREDRPSVDRSGGTIPRISRLMALAIHFDQLIREGVVVDQAELARLGHVSRARLTQIMNMLNLAPDVQEEILRLPSVEQGRDTISERHLRPITAQPNWQEQRRKWQTLCGKSPSHSSAHG
jgi:hypothetical protein